MRRALPTLLAVLVALPVAAAAPQQSSSEVGRLQAEFRDERARALRLRAEAAEAAAEIARLERELAGLRADVASGDTRIAAQRARLRQLSEREAALVARLAGARGRQTRLLSALQMISRRPPPPLLVPADKAIDTVRAAILMKATAPSLQAQAKALADRQAEIVRVRRLAALGSEALFTAESEQGDRRARVEALSARQTRLRAVLRAEAEAAEKAAAALEARLRALGGAVPQPDAETAVVAARRPAGRDRLTRPVEGAPTIRFGNGSSGWRWRWRGEELQARAPAAGVVAWTGPLEGWGQVVVLDLGPGWRAVVSGLDEVLVDTGDRVADGQPLGRADGEIGFDLRRDERPVDPGLWLR